MEFYDSAELAAKLRQVDRQLVGMLAHRVNLALQVEAYRCRSGGSLRMSATQDERLAEVRAWAKAKGLSPDLAHSVVQILIQESYTGQSVQLPPDYPIQDQDAWYQRLKQNLLELTAKVAQIYDEKYDTAFFATRSYLDFENRILGQELGSMEDQALALDLGCATGRQSFRLARHFDSVAGYDVSPDMIARAHEKQASSPLHNLTFETADIENGLPQSDNSVSFIIMNLGTASDLRNIRLVLFEAQRVLKPQGRIFLSFYNADALVYRLGVIPWQVGLAAEINMKTHCVEVHCGSEVYPVYARSYRAEEIRALMPDAIEVTQMFAHPTIASILPNELFEEKLTRDSIAEIDRKLVDSSAGAYIIALGRKT